MTKTRLAGVELRLVAILYNNNNSWLEPNEFAKKLSYATNWIYVKLRELERGGYLEKASYRGQGLRVQYRLTEYGIAVVKKTFGIEQKNPLESEDNKEVKT